jgi:hypothetical protein
MFQIAEGELAMCVQSLQQELATYQREKSRLVSESEGKFVLIKGDEVAGVWGTYEDALREGYEQFGLTPFLVKQVREIDNVCFFTRELAPCS